jgi:hypothetical protein
MKSKSVFVTGALLLLVVTAACEKTSPAAPTTSSAASAATLSSGESPVTIASTGVTLGAATLVAPVPNRQFKFNEQPVTLIVNNGLTTGTTPLTYMFEVATDTGFTSKAFTRGVAQGTGQTSVTVDRLPAGKTYYWRARTTAGNDVGPNSAVRSFDIGPEVILQTPVPSTPGNSTTVSSGSVTLVVNNVTRSGPAGQIFYKFDLSDSAAFSRILSTSTLAEQSGSQTAWAVPSGVVTKAGSYYWRVAASDPSNNITPPGSQVFSFNYQPFDMRTAVIWDNPKDMGSWPETAQITSIIFTDDAFLVDFDRREGPNRWPDVGFGSGSIEYTLGMCLNINGEWNCSAVVQFWYGRELSASGRPDEIGINWFYDARWGTLLGHQPAYGETVGIFVAAGNQRDSGNTIAYERSNVVLMPFGGQYTLGQGVSAARVAAARRK